MDGHEPSADKIGDMVEEVGVRDAVDGGIDGEEKEEDVGDVFESDESSCLIHTLTQKDGIRGAEGGGKKKTYFVVTLGIIFPLVRVSTRSINGIMDKTLWCDENGVSQCTARLCTQTSKTNMLIGSTQSMRIRMECA